MSKTSSGLVKYAIAQLGRPYWYGTFGQKSTKSLYKQKKKQYPRYYTANNFDKQLNEKVHDCIGLIKGYMWCKSPNDMNPVYESNGCPDINEEMMYSRAKTKGSISTMPKQTGILVYKKGHIGVYIGDDYVVEARGHSYGVVKTKLSSRGWTNWCKCPYIKYDTKDEKPVIKKPKVKVETNGSVLNCRKKASILSGIAGTFANGKTLTLLSKANKKWYKVKGKAVSGKTITGYCSSTWLKEI